MSKPIYDFEFNVFENILMILKRKKSSWYESLNIRKFGMSVEKMFFIPNIYNVNNCHVINELLKMIEC